MTIKKTHTHHIIPRYMGGTNDPENLIELTIEEHAEAHRKLWEEYNQKEDYIAWKALSGQISFSEASRLAIELGAERGRKNRRNLKRSEESKRAQSKAMKNKTPWNKGIQTGQIPWNKGKTGIYSEDTLRKMSESSKGKAHSEEVKERVLKPITIKYKCDCGCGKEYNIGNLTKHKKAKNR